MYHRGDINAMTPLLGPYVQLAPSQGCLVSHDRIYTFFSKETQTTTLFTY